MISLVKAALLGNQAVAPLHRLALLLRRNAVREAGWIGLGEVAAALGSLVAVRLITELIDPQQYGLLTLTIGIVTLALSFTVSPFLQAAMRLRSEFAADDLRAGLLRSESLRIIRWFVLLACVVMVAGGALLGEELDAPSWIGAVMAAMLVVEGVRSYEIAMLNAARRQMAMSLWQGVEAWGRPLLAVALVLALGASMVSVLAGYIAATLLTAVVFATWIPLDGTAVHSSGSRTTAGQTDAALILRRQIWRMVLPLLPVAFLSWVTSLSDRYIIAGMLGVQEAGLYAAAYALVSRPFLLIGSFLDSWLRPRLYEGFSSGDPDAVRRIIVSWAALSVGIGAAGVLCFLVLNRSVAELLLAAPYRAASDLMPLIALGYAFAIVAQLAGRICYACNRTDYVLVVEFVSAAAAVTVTIPAVATWGLYGAAIAVPAYFGTQLVAASLLAISAARGRILDRRLT